jgi:hypothetical protein
MKGNSWNGAAAAWPENATAPIVTAPNAAAARREFSLRQFSFNELNIGRPLFAPARHLARRWGDQYRSTVSGRLHEIAKMVSSH